MRSASQSYLSRCSIFTSANHARTRLGWVSVSTGLTYCGICLRAQVPPEVGANCSACGARVTEIFDLAAAPASARAAWSSPSLISRQRKLIIRVSDRMVG